MAALVAAIIPARGGSKRLSRKNIHPVAGLPMLAWSIRACRASRRITDVFVSTEDAEIAAIARAEGATVVDRPLELATDEVYKQDAIVHALDALERQGRRFDLVCSVQANSPELTPQHLDALARLGPSPLHRRSFAPIAQYSMFPPTGPLGPAHEIEAAAPESPAVAGALIR